MLQDCNYFRCPPFSKRQSVEAMVERLANRVVGGYKRKKLSLNATSSMDDSLQSAESHDMEYEETPGNVSCCYQHILLTFDNQTGFNCLLQL